MDDDDDNLDFTQFKDPFQRLEELEELVSRQSQALAEIHHQLVNHAEHFQQISQAMIHTTRMIQTYKMQISSLHQETQNLHHRLRILENKEQK